RPPWPSSEALVLRPRPIRHDPVASSPTDLQTERAACRCPCRLVNLRAVAERERRALERGGDFERPDEPGVLGHRPGDAEPGRERGPARAAGGVVVQVDAGAADRADLDAEPRA